MEQERFLASLVGGCRRPFSWRQISAWCRSWTRSQSMGHQFLIERRAEAESNPRPSAYQRNALPQGQRVSLHKCFIHCGGTRSQTHSVHESQHTTRTGEPKRNRTYVPLLTSLTPFRWAKRAHYTKGEECCLFDRIRKTKTTVWKFKRKAPI